MEDKPNDIGQPDGLDSPADERPLRRLITREMIAERAYLISQSDQAGTDEENWLRAEQELREEEEG